MQKTLTRFAAIALLSLALGCAGTVAPKPVLPTQPSWSASGQNSGMIRMVEAGWIVDADWVTRYKALCASKFADELSPKPNPDACANLGDGTSLASFKVVSDFAFMNLRRKMTTP